MPTAQRLFIDTEFTDFINCDLISIGAITEDGKHEFYVEISDYQKDWESSFVKEHIIPLLDGPDYAIPYMKAAAKFAAWVDELPIDTVHVAVDYGTDWDFTVMLLNDAGGIPQKVYPEALNIIAEMHAAVIKQCSRRDLQASIDGTTLLEGTVPMHVAMREHKNVFNDAFMEHFYENHSTPKYRNHHALYDARANRLAWMAAMKYINSL